MNKLIACSLFISFKLFSMHFDHEENKDESAFAEQTIIWRDDREGFYSEEKWVCMFCFLTSVELPVFIKTSLKIKQQHERIYGKDYVTPQIMSGLTDRNKYVTICAVNTDEYLAIRYDKSNKKSIGIVSSSRINLQYVPVDQISSLYIWSDEYNNIPINEELGIARLLCCCIDQRMAVIHQLDGDEDALVITFKEE